MKTNTIVAQLNDMELDLVSGGGSWKYKLHLDVDAKSSVATDAKPAAKVEASAGISLSFGN